MLTTLAVVFGSVAQPPDTNWFLSVAPAILVSAVETAKPMATSGRHGERPLLVNLASFVVLGSMATNSDLASKDVAGALGQPFEDVSPGRAFQCRPLGELPDCQVLRDGLYIELNHLMMTPSGYEVLVTTKVTSPRLPHGGRVIDFQVVRLLFAPENGKWTVTKREIIAQS